MTTSVYMDGRRRYKRPQGILWSDNPGTLVDGFYVPTGYEIGASVPEGTNVNMLDQFLVLTDHNRADISFVPERIEQRQRTINGRMRSYHISDKLKISTSWSNLPSRSYSLNPAFGSDGKATTGLTENVADGGAGGVEMLDWYENHKGPFWMFLSYDKYSNFGKEDEAYEHLNKYNQIIEVYFSDFNYNVVKRGGSNFDLWNVSVSLEEV